MIAARYAPRAIGPTHHHQRAVHTARPPACYLQDMPVYLFTYHAYGSWLPDKPDGYVKRNQGIHTQNHDRASRYREHMKHPPMRFNQRMQRVMVDSAQATAGELGLRLHYACVTDTHAHALVSWSGDTDWQRLRTRIKQRLGRDLSVALDRKGPWFSEGSSRKRVRTDVHLHQLMHTYLPKPDHRGTHCREGAGVWIQ